MCILLEFEDSFACKAHVHAHRVVHGDLKPSNWLWDKLQKAAVPLRLRSSIASLSEWLESKKRVIKTRTVRIRCFAAYRRENASLCCPQH